MSCPGDERRLSQSPTCWHPVPTPSKPITRACDSLSLLWWLVPGLSLCVPPWGCGPQSPRHLQVQKVGCGWPSDLLPVPSASRHAPPGPGPLCLCLECCCCRPRGLSHLPRLPAPRREAQGLWLEEPRGAAPPSAPWPPPHVPGERFSSLGGEMGIVPLGGVCSSVESGVCVHHVPRTGPGGGWVCVG